MMNTIINLINQLGTKVNLFFLSKLLWNFRQCLYFVKQLTGLYNNWNVQYSEITDHLSLINTLSNFLNKSLQISGVHCKELIGDTTSSPCNG